jgi:hypothetical protein
LGSSESSKVFWLRGPGGRFSFSGKGVKRWEQGDGGGSGGDIIGTSAHCYLASWGS